MELVNIVLSVLNDALIHDGWKDSEGFWKDVMRPEIGAPKWVIDAKRVETDIYPENKNNGYLTEHSASVAAHEEIKNWGSNLVYMGATKKNGRWFPQFNVFD